MGFLQSFYDRRERRAKRSEVADTERIRERSEGMDTECSEGMDTHLFRHARVAGVADGRWQPANLLNRTLSFRYCDRFSQIVQTARRNKAPGGQISADPMPR